MMALRGRERSPSAGMPTGAGWTRPPSNPRDSLPPPRPRATLFNREIEVIRPNRTQSAIDMNRNGKIARLPEDLRQELNERLCDGEAGTSLVAWLNGLPEVQAVMAAEFGGVPI